MHNEGFVSVYHNSDHNRLDLILNSLVEAVREEKSFELQQSLFYLFKSGLLRHLHWEDTVLFPMFEQEMKLQDCPIQSLKYEHAEINLALSNIEDTLDNKIDLAKIIALANYLDEHNTREEKQVYLAMEEILDKDTQELMAVAISRDFK